MIAGLPKAPSRFNPVASPKQAVVRRNYVLRRMLELGYIVQDEHDAARDAPVTAKVHGLAVEVEAPYVAEMVRAHMEQTYGDDAYTAGYKVYTTLDGRLQGVANAALRQGLLEYDARHGFRGSERHVASGEEAEPPRDVLEDIAEVGGLVPAVVTSVDERTVAAWVRNAGPVEIGFESMEWARPYIDENRRGDEPKGVDAVLKAGDVIRVRRTGDEWSFAQVPKVEGALVSLDPDDGSIVALDRRIRFLSQQVQPRDPGRAPARIELQAVHLLRRAGVRLHPRQHHQRRPGGVRGSEPQERVAARELRRQVLRPDPSCARRCTSRATSSRFGCCAR